MISTKDLSIFSNNFWVKNERNVWSTLTHFLEASSSTGRSFFFMRLFRLKPLRIFNLKTKNLAQEGFFVKLDYIMVPQTKASPHFEAVQRIGIYRKYSVTLQSDCVYKVSMPKSV